MKLSTYQAMDGMFAKLWCLIEDEEDDELKPDRDVWIDRTEFFKRFNENIFISIGGELMNVTKIEVMPKRRQHVAITETYGSVPIDIVYFDVRVTWTDGKAATMKTEFPLGWPVDTKELKAAGTRIAVLKYGDDAEVKHAT